MRRRSFFTRLSLPAFGLALVLTSAGANAWAQTISTIAGGGAGDGGPATRGGLDGPSSVAVDASGNLFIADRDNHRIRMVAAATGITMTVAGTGEPGVGGDEGPATSAQLLNPTSVAVEASGNLYTADQGNHRVRKVVLATGVIATVAGTGDGDFGGDGGPATSAVLSSPAGVAVDGAGNLYISDQGNHRVRKVVLATGVITTVAGTGEADFGGDGGPATSAALNSPAGLAVDGAGNLFIADTYNHRVRKIAASGEQVPLFDRITTVAGTGEADFGGDGGPATSAALNLPSGLAVDGGGNLFIADANNHRVRRVTLATGIITTVAGTGEPDFAGDGGPAASAQLTFPTGLAFSGGGDLFIADQGNQRIRLMTLPQAPPQAPPPPPRLTVTTAGVQQRVAISPVDSTTQQGVGDAVTRLFLRPGVQEVVGQAPDSGVLAVQATETRQFAFLPLGVRGEDGVRRAAASSPSLTLDPFFGTASVTTPQGTQVEVMGAPPDLEAFLALLRPLGITGLTIKRGHYILQTQNPAVSGIVRLDFDLRRGAGAPGPVARPDGTAQVIYPGGTVQRGNPVFADLRGLLQMLPTQPGYERSNRSPTGPSRRPSTAAGSASGRTSPSVRPRPGRSARSSRRPPARSPSPAATAAASASPSSPDPARPWRGHGRRPRDPPCHTPTRAGPPRSDDGRAR